MNRRLLPLFDLLCVGICAALMGHAATLTFRRAPAATRPPSRAAAPHGDASRATPEAIVRRNVFCSTCPVPGDAHGRETTVERQRSRLPLVLVAINFVAGPPRERRVMATLRHLETGSIGAFHEGARILGARITAVRPDGVDLDNGGVPEFLDLLPGSGPPVRQVDSDQGGIRQTAPHQYEIDRASLEAALGNLNQLASSVRVVPEVKAGRPAGFRVVDVRAGSLLAGLGLLRGDVLHAINGLELTSVEKAMEVYLKLKSAGHLALVVERGGVMTTLQYTVR
jgi:general secretion pathway protein C